MACLVTSTSVFLLAENRLLREALARILTKRTDFKIAGSMAFGASIPEELVRAQPDIVLSDTPELLFGPTNFASHIRVSVQKAKLVLVGMERDEEHFLQALREGVVGYTLKDATAVEIVAAIRSVARGEAVCPPSLMLTLFQTAARSARQMTANRMTSAESALSRREQQLVHHLALGMTNKEIACKLNISDQTVKNHVHRILRKLGAKDRQMIAQLMRTQGETTLGAVVNG
jgi:DNA-binding NarL/FixJ family response regulator